MVPQNKNLISSAAGAVRRVRIWYGLLVAVLVIFGLRLFYVQVIRYGHYKTAALSDQLKQYQIPATRGIIEAHDAGSVVPIVLNQQLYTLFADPTLVKQPQKEAAAVAQVVGGQPSDYLSEITAPHTRYSVLAKKLTSAQNKRILAYKFPGLATQEQDYRTYPQGQLAAQTLGFVNDDGQGEYGVEQALNNELKGTPGELKALTDIHGVPLAASKDNVQIAPQPGKNVVLTLDMGIQAQMEQILKSEAQKTHSQLLSAVIIDPDNGQIKAMANYPTYNPAKYYDVSNPSVFQNSVVSNAIEPGSIMKTLTTSAALNLGAIQPNESFYDPAHWVVDKYNITDIEQDGGAREQNIQSILALSLNTGATWELMQMSQPGGTNITQRGIEAWHNYMVNHFLLGRATGVQQGYESTGYVPKDDPSQPAIQLTYANTAFGQGVTVTALQMAAALSSVINGGTYYQPTLVDQTVNPDGTTVTAKPKVLERNVVKPQTGQELIPLMEGVVKQYLSEGFGFMNFPGNYLVGGKTGTAQIAKPGGGYDPNVYNGTYVGFVGGNKPQYVICVFNNKPVVPGYAGSYGGQPVFADLAHMLINDGYVTPKN